MNILFLTIGRIVNVKDAGIYTDLMRKFKAENHNVYIVSPSERRYREKAELVQQDGIHLLKVKTLNIQKSGFLEKGLATISIEYLFLKYVKKYLNDIKFDLVIYSTPPITFARVIDYVKRRDNALSYLLLKDIFPQNAVDLGILKKNGFLHKYFVKKEKTLYKISDYIGCMSPANVNFLIQHNPELDKNKIEVNPNSIELVPKKKPIHAEKNSIRAKYDIPASAIVFIYGGNLGKPQGIGFLIQAILSNQKNDGLFFVIAGDGTEYSTIQSSFAKNQVKNALLLKSLPKSEYEELLLACDVGLIFLDKRFTIPNFPSRLLSYMEASMPILSATDRSTDIGKIMEENGFGLWSESGDLLKFNTNLKQFENPDKNTEMGNLAYQFLLDNYLVKYSYDIITSKFS